MIFPQQEGVYGKLTHILDVFSESQAGIRPHFHMTGPSGSGKTFLIGKACEERKIPMIEINAAGLTQEGLSGNSLSKALRKLREVWNQPNVVFVDEFDKLFQRNGEKTEDFRSAVQDEFLTALESKYQSIFTDYGKYEPVRIDNSLFVFAGAYSNQEIRTMDSLRDAGLRREFIGRVPLVVYTDEIPVAELKKHVTKVDLYKQYKALYPETDDKAAVRGIMKMMDVHSQELSIGIRILNTAIHLHFMDLKA